MDSHQIGAKDYTMNNHIDFHLNYASDHHMTNPKSNTYKKISKNSIREFLYTSVRRKGLHLVQYETKDSISALSILSSSRQPARKIQDMIPDKAHEEI